MKLKTLIVTIVVLAAASLGVYFAGRPSAPKSADARLGQPLIDRAAIEKCTRLRITDAGKKVELVRQSDGGAWRVASYYDLPADFSKLSSFVGSLTEAKLERLVTTNPERIARLEFKDTRIELLDSADKPLAAVTLGKNPDTGGGRFVRFGEEPKAYLATLNAWLDTESKNWANAELINVKADDVAALEVPFADGGPVTLSRAKKEDPWSADKTPAAQRVKADKVSSVLSSVGMIRFTETTPPDDANAVAAKANLRTFKLTTFDHKTITVALGRKPEEKKLKPPAAGTDGKSGPAALGSVADLTKKNEAKDEKSGEPKSADEKKDKPLAPEFETIPAGPVFAFITHSDASAPVNAIMQKRAFQISDYVFTGLPQKSDELFEPAPTPAPAAPTAAPANKDAAPAAEKKPATKK